ncbi:hypothetical protein WJX82_001431 [Trebouxia sp. C0006]
MLTTLLSNSQKAVAKTLLLYVVSCREFNVNFRSQLAPLNFSLQLKHTFVGSSADSTLVFPCLKAVVDERQLHRT